MDPLTIAGLVSTGASAFGSLFGIFGANESNNAANAAADDQLEQAEELYEFDWENTLRQYNYAKSQVDVARQAATNVRDYKTKNAVRNWQQQMMLREFEYVNKVKQFNRSERQFEDQSALNNLSATLAKNDAARSFNEAQLSMNFEREGLARDLYEAMDTSAFVKAEISLKKNTAITDASSKRRQNEFEYQTKSAEKAFEAQDSSVKALLGEGQARVRGGSGRSKGRVIQSVLAAAGRNQSQIVQSMATAEQRFKIQASSIDQSMISAINNADLQSAQQDNSIDYKRQSYNQNLRELDASLDSAEAAYNSNLMKINRDKQAADMNAHYNRMSEPTLGPEILRPIELPNSVFLDPLPPVKGPGPKRNAPQTQSAWTTFAQAAIGVGNVAGTIGDVGNTAGWFG
tara:strand:- start:2049 stop:3254 length:1206 start_codon:yes stop_codon:yes gene_type:complete